MKLWQLDAVMNDRKLMKAMARTQDNWRFLVSWIEQFSDLVNRQDRAKLDYILPLEYVRCALTKSDLKYYLSNDGQLRSHASRQDYEVLSALEAFDLYGGTIIEEVLEYGSYKVF